MKDLSCHRPQECSHHKVYRTQGMALLNQFLQGLCLHPHLCLCDMYASESQGSVLGYRNPWVKKWCLSFVGKESAPMIIWSTWSSEPLCPSPSPHKPVFSSRIEPKPVGFFSTCSQHEVKYCLILSVITTDSQSCSGTFSGCVCYSGLTVKSGCKG
jgi:hypothetical protein